MASRRLVQRSRQNEDSSPASRSRPQSNANSRQRHQDRQQPTPLPPYEPPSCPLSAEARIELNQLRITHDYAKYKQHLKTSKLNLINTTSDVFDRVSRRKATAEKETNKRRKTGEHDKSEEEIAAIRGAKDLEEQALEIRTKAEKALRELLDFDDEQAMNDQIMKDLITKIPPAPAARPAKRPRVGNDDDGSDNEDAAAAEDEEILEIPEVAGVSTLGLLKDGREDYKSTYSSKSMRQRYENTDYSTFIRMVHSARFGDEDPPPHARTWFTEDGQPALDASGNQQDNNDDSDSDDEVVIARASVNLKCPMTLQYFKEPYSNTVCNHTFEKSAITDYYRQNGVHTQAFDARGRPAGLPGAKKVTCPQSGCNKEFDLNDFHDDPLIARQVKRAQAEEAREDEDDDDEDEDAPRPTLIGSDDDVDMLREGQHRNHVSKVKKERGQSQGRSMAHSKTGNDSSMALDEEEEDDDDDDD